MGVWEWVWEWVLDLFEVRVLRLIFFEGFCYKALGKKGLVVFMEIVKGCVAQQDK